MDNSWSQQQHQQQQHQQQQHSHHQQSAHHQQHHPQPPQSQQQQQQQQQQPHSRQTQQAQPPHSQRQQAPDSARSTGSAQASSYSQGGRTFGTINPNYRQAQSYNPSPTENTHPPGQIHEAYKRSSAEGQSNNASANASSGRDVYSARAETEQQHGAAAANTTGQTTATGAPAKAPAKRVRKPKQPAAPVETALPQDGPADGTTGPPLPFDTKPLYTRLEQLTKTQTDLITYLHAELDRRRDWEEMMVKEMHQRHSVLLTLITTLVPVNGSLGQGPRPDGLSNNLSSTIGRAGLPGIPAVSAMGSMSALHEQEAPQSQAFEQEYEDEPSRPSGRSELPAFDTPARTTTFEPNSARSAYSAYPGPSTPQLAGSKRARMDEDDYADLGKDANVEVDERGVIYMCGGRKMGIVPTKIQSLVRKSLYAAQGVPTGRIQLPLYISGMYPANGDEHWAFGNLRYDWHSTTRKSTHNSEMKRIVIEHIVSHRYAYAEIPDSEFSADRLDHAYEQSFNHWKSKFMGKKSSGIKTKRPKTIGIREIQKILDTVGTGDDSEMEHEDGATDRNTSSIRAEPNSAQGMRIDDYTPTTNPPAPLSSGQPAPASDIQAPRPTAAT